MFYSSKTSHFQKNVYYLSVKENVTIHHDLRQGDTSIHEQPTDLPSILPKGAIMYVQHVQESHMTEKITLDLYKENQ